MKPLRQRGLSTRLGVYVLVTLLLLAGMVTLAGYLQVRASLTKAVIAELETVATLKEDTLNLWFEEQTAELVFLTNQPELQTQVRVLSRADSAAADYVAAYMQVTQYFADLLLQKEAFSAISLLHATSGKVLVSTDISRIGDSYLGERYYRWAASSGVAVQNIVLNPYTQRPTLLVVAPIWSDVGTVSGVVMVDLDLGYLNRIFFTRMGLETQGDTYVLDGAGQLLAGRWAAGAFPSTLVSEGITAALQNKLDGAGAYRNYAGVPVVGVYRWLDDSEVALFIEIAQREAYAPARSLAWLLLGVLSSALFLLLGGVYWLGIWLDGFVVTLTNTAAQVAGGDFSVQLAKAPIAELEALFGVFNQMTGYLGVWQADMTARLAEHSQTSAQRARQLDTVAQTAAELTTATGFDALLDNAVAFIAERFACEQVAFFQLDETREFAVLRAAALWGGALPIAVGERLRLEAHTLLGVAAATGELRRTVSKVTAELPTPRVELCAPLKAQGVVVGLLDLQAVDPAALTEADVAVVQIIANQLALALANASSLQRATEALNELEIFSGERWREAWLERLARTRFAYRYTGVTVEPLLTDVAELAPDALGAAPAIRQSDSGRELLAPLLYRGQMLGSVVFQQDAAQKPWTAEELALLNVLTEQTALALDNARLLEEAEQRAARERLIADVTQAMRQSLDMDVMLRTTLREIAEAFELDAVEVRLGRAPADGAAAEGGSVA